MKIRDEHYAVLEAAVKQVLEAHPGVVERYLNQGLSSMRLRWDLLWASEKHLPKYWITQTLYPYLSDPHIDSAMKRITGTQ
jgi:hypothetical protein